MQRQLRLGDILDDYCPRERRLTNHAVVAMVGESVKQTRCVTCDAEHEYKHAKVPRQRRQDSPAGLQAQVLAGAPKKLTDPPAAASEQPGAPTPASSESTVPLTLDAVRRALAIPGVPTASSSSGGFGRDSRHASPPAREVPEAVELDAEDVVEEEAPPDSVDGSPNEPQSEGPAHRRLIRATLPRLEGQPPTTRPAPDFTIRTPTGGRPPRFRPRNQRGGGQTFSDTRQGSSGNTARGGPPRGGNNRPPQASRQSRRFDGRKRSK